MIDKDISPRYAKTLFNLDRQNDNLQQRTVDFDLMLKILKKNPKLEKFLLAPQVMIKDKKDLLQKTVGGLFDASFMNFLFFLLQKGRLNILSHISEEYRLMVDKHLEIWEAEITTAVPMDEESELRLKQKLEKDFHKKIYLTKKVDPKIIGGAILVIANEMLDWSVKGRLRRMKENLILGAQ